MGILKFPLSTLHWEFINFTGEDIKIKNNIKSKNVLKVFRYNKTNNVSILNFL